MTRDQYAAAQRAAADSAANVAEVNRQASIPACAVIEAIDLPDAP